MNRLIGCTFTILPLASVAAQPATAVEDTLRNRLEIVRFQNNPIIRPEMLPGHDGGNRHR